MGKKEPELRENNLLIIALLVQNSAQKVLKGKKVTSREILSASLSRNVIAEKQSFLSPRHKI